MWTFGVIQTLRTERLLFQPQSQHEIRMATVIPQDNDFNQNTWILQSTIFPLCNSTIAK